MVQINQLSFSYRRKSVFNALDLRLQPGFVYGLLGKNGTGKSTLLRSIAGLLYPHGGSIRIGEEVPSARRPSFLQDVFMVPEEFYLPNVSISEYVKTHACFYPKFQLGQFYEYLQQFSVPTGQRLQQMSYGQKKKLLISFGLATNSSLLLMDEPTNGLDIMAKSQFRKVMAGAVDDHKCIVISTHQVKDLDHLIDRITVIEEGSILFDQSLEAIGQYLLFTNAPVKDQSAELIYAEESLRGYNMVLENTYQEPSPVDLELLYKAVVLHGERVNRAFVRKDQD